MAVFRQHTSRTIDPQLHTHAVIVGQGPGPDRPVAVARRPVPEVPAAHHRLGLRRRPAHRAHRTASASAGDRSTAGRPTWPASPTTVRDAVLAAHRAGRARSCAELIGRWSDEHDGADPDARTIARARTPSRRSPPGPARPTASTPPSLHERWAGPGPSRRARPRRASTPTAPRPHPARHVELDDERWSPRRCAGSSEEAATWLPADLARHVATLLPPDAAGTAAELVALDRPARRRGRRALRRRSAPTAAPARDRRDGRPVAEHVTDRRLTTAGRPRPGDSASRTGPAPTPTTARARTDDPQADAADGDRRARRSSCWSSDRPGPARPTPSPAPSHDLRRPGPAGRRAGPLGQGRRRPRHRGRLPDRHPRRVPHPPPATRPHRLAGRDDGRSSTKPAWPPPTTSPSSSASPSATTGGSSPSATPPSSPPSDAAACSPTGATPSPHHHLDTPRRFTEPWEADASLALRRGDPDAAQTYAAPRPAPHHPPRPPPRARSPPTYRPPRRRRPDRRHHHQQRRHRPRHQPAPSKRRRHRGDRPTASRSPTAPTPASATRSPPAATTPTSRTDQRRAGPQPPHLDRHRRRTPTAPLTVHHPDRGTVDAPRRLRRPARRARLGRHRLRQPRRHRRHRHRRPRTRHHPQPHLRRPHPRPRQPTTPASPTPPAPSTPPTTSPPHRHRSSAAHAALATLHRLHHEAGLPTPAVEQVLQVDPPALELGR